MAVDVCSISEVSTSPRISFSHDLDDPETKSDSTHSIRSDQFLLSPTFHFDFCTTSTFTPADELFSNGKILPTQIKKPQTIQLPDPKTKISDTHKKRLKEFIFHGEQEDEEKSTLKSSFWQFRRSASLNCDNGKGPKGLLRSLSLKSLSRSNSTGSALNPKRNSSPKTMEKSKDLRRCSSLSQPPASSHVYYTYQNSNNSKSCKGGIRIIPILNIPPAYNISKGTINFFGFGSLFCNGKAKKKTK
ncbi:uncharacterized protein LOC112525849 [Cynara cardunculus var. scolymus]|uniref:Uncharacterized protein n=1 Tax=Cynara cardunculus var. scolymus TaxID=59895 RepID=A0A103YAA4_CYNCS|nr:uncharacterized protein LOC112525849 [Cynara cardunculus var. scolymus]KVI05414.1 hypothetical protein Ccrd_016301 [Cynara cardunculus var. scolymus]